MQANSRPERSASKAGSSWLDADRRVAFGIEDVRQQGADLRLVLDDEHAARAGDAGGSFGHGNRARAELQTRRRGVGFPTVGSGKSCRF
jgi:hypothetical protein